MFRLDSLIIAFDRGLRTVFAPAQSMRPNPGAGVFESGLSADERAEAGRLMRVNHSGEVCAQALYQGQALTARDAGVQAALEKASHEEIDHLAQALIGGTRAAENACEPVS